MPSKHTMTPNVLSKLFAVPWIPHNYQKKAVKFLLTHAASGLFLPPGLGKTGITLKALTILFKEKLAKKVLVIAPLRVCFSVWPGEVEKFKDFSHLKVVVLHGDAGDKDELLKQDGDIFVINPEGLDWLLQTEKRPDPRNSKKKLVSVDVRKFKRLGFDTLIIDELTKFKNHASDRFKALKQVLPTFSRRWGLTGSPAANGLIQLFGQMYCLDQGRSLGAYITHYRRKYFHEGYDGFSWILNEGAEEQIYEAINPLVLRISEEDAGLDVPQLVVNDIWVDLDPKAMQIYKAMEDDLITAIEDGLIVAKNTGVAMGKCRQIANGAIYKTQDVEALVKLPKSKREWALVHDAKYQAVEDLLEELQGTPILMSYEFEHDYDRLKALYPEATFVASVPMKKFKALEESWNAGEVPQLFTQSSSVSHGLNLQKAGNHIGMIGIPWDFEVYEQLIRRIKRQGNSNKRVFLHRILARGTVDEVIAATLDSKDRTQQALFEGLKKLRSQRKRRAVV